MREERGETRAERRKKRDEISKKTARDPQMRPREAIGPAGWLRKGSVPKMEEGREQRKERREKIAASSIHCIFTRSRGHLDDG